MGFLLIEAYSLLSLEEALPLNTSLSSAGLNFKTLSKSCCEDKQGFRVPFTFTEFSVTGFMN